MFFLVRVTQSLIKKSLFAVLILTNRICFIERIIIIQYFFSHKILFIDVNYTLKSWCGSTSFVAFIISVINSCFIICSPTILEVWGPVLCLLETFWPHTSPNQQYYRKLLRLSFVLLQILRHHALKFWLASTNSDQVTVEVMCPGAAFGF